MYLEVASGKILLIYYGSSISKQQVIFCVQWLKLPRKLYYVHKSKTFLIVYKLLNHIYNNANLLS